MIEREIYPASSEEEKIYNALPHKGHWDRFSLEHKNEIMSAANLIETLETWYQEDLEGNL